jgi:TPP-dependent pyruvate/acetoin dehydrogenase alpha subunit
MKIRRKSVMQDIPNQHEISEPHIHQAEEHSKIALKHSETVAQVGKRLQEQGHVSPEIIQRIEDSAKTMQEYAEESLAQVEILKESRSTEDLLKASQQHVEEGRAFAQAIGAFLEASQEKHP